MGFAFELQIGFFFFLLGCKFADIDLFEWANQPFLPLICYYCSDQNLVKENFYVFVKPRQIRFDWDISSFFPNCLLSSYLLSKEHKGINFRNWYYSDPSLISPSQGLMSNKWKSGFQNTVKISISWQTFQILSGLSWEFRNEKMTFYKYFSS